MTGNNNHPIQIVSWNNTLEKQVLELLYKYEETSLLLLSNLKTYGSKLTSDTYSGNFKILVKDKKVIAVFVLTKEGGLLAQTDRKHDYSELIVNECLKESIIFKGVVAAWEVAKQIFEFTKSKFPNLKETFCEKEILYSLDLDLFDQKNLIQYEARLLKEKDFEVWNNLHTSFLNEAGLTSNEDIIARRNRFNKQASQGCWMGSYINNELIAIAAIGAHVNNTGQIGSVYTIPNMRNKGVSKSLMSQLLLHGKTNKNIHKAVLFSRPHNSAAIKVYESLGFKRIGSFGLFFWQYEK